jgi:hypothetical protein
MGQYQAHANRENVPAFSYYLYDTEISSSASSTKSNITAP